MRIDRSKTNQEIRINPSISNCQVKGFAKLRAFKVFENTKCTGTG